MITLFKQKLTKYLKLKQKQNFKKNVDIWNLAKIRRKATAVFTTVGIKGISAVVKHETGMPKI